MHKEWIISIIVLVFILSLNYITQKNTDNTVNMLTNKLKVIRQDLNNENKDKEKILSHINEAYEKWEELDDMMAYYIEHTDLEKVSTSFTSIKSYAEVEMYDESIEEVDKCNTILQNIHEKDSLNLENIF